ncbi:MAG: A/G-specific adenine glycosylase, partial [bacterium]|nr:A/G-specific adenine glycosylase [bacterium]
MNLSPQKRTAIKRHLLAWYDRCKRDLPWRRTSDPYRILLSEFMLQQTRVETVIPYYQRFLESFPTVHDLAQAPQERVLKAWEGLGYYARARNLHRAASLITDRFNGNVPTTYEDLSSLPGFGPYTTAAVLSIAFNQDHAVVDGNVIRVLCRLFNIREDIAQTAVKNQLQELADTLLHKGDAGNFNQALMELGATVCLPKSPNCTTCPVSSHCIAYQSGEPESLPVKAPKKKRPHHTMGVGIVQHNSTFLIARRPEDGLLGGLWEFPATRKKTSESLQDCCLRGILETTDVHAKIKTRFHTVKHAFTHFSVTMHAFRCEYQNGQAGPVGCTEARWVSP